MNKRVLVVGVFNVLHPGHVRMLRFAKECGDVLTVAVLPDGKDNQSIHVDESLRLECILSNSYVDDAFIVHGDVNDLIERLRPDVLVKGREFEDKYNPEEEILNKYGGELVFDSGEVLFSSLDLLEKEFDGGSGIPGGMPYGYMKRQHIEPIKLLHHLNLIS